MFKSIAVAARDRGRMQASSSAPRDEGSAKAIKLAGWLVGGTVVLHALTDLLIHLT